MTRNIDSAVLVTWEQITPGRAADGRLHPIVKRGGTLAEATAYFCDRSDLDIHPAETSVWWQGAEALITSGYSVILGSVRRVAA